MSLFSKQREYYERLRVQLDALCPPEEPLLGSVIAADKGFLKSELFGVIGGWAMSQAMGDDSLAGIDAMVAFLQSSRLP